MKVEGCGRAAAADFSTRTEAMKVAADEIAGLLDQVEPRVGAGGRPPRTCRTILVSGAPDLELRTSRTDTRPPREPPAAARARALLIWSAASTSTVIQTAARPIRGDRTAGTSIPPR